MDVTEASNDFPQVGSIVDNNFVVGIDAGGTKVLIVDTISTNYHRFEAIDFPHMYSILDEYLSGISVRPRRIAIAMAGLRDDTTGDVHPTNIDWPIFSPSEASKRFPGTEFVTTNDMIASAAGVTAATSVYLTELKSGNPKPTGSKVTVAISTGVNTCPAIWDARGQKWVYAPAEAGHVGFQPKTEAHKRHLAHINNTFEHASVELAISGKYGVESWIEHSPEMSEALELSDAVSRAKADERPIGAVLLEFATEGSGKSRDAARSILGHMAELVASILADYALAYKATGGIYLTGSVATGLGEYWSQHEGFAKAFVRNSKNAVWMEKMLQDIPIFLVTDPNIAAAGALALAKEN